MVGANPHAANPVQWARIKEAKARGAKIVVLDPMRSEAAKIADLWLRPHPGTDAAIALAMMHVLIAGGSPRQGFHRAVDARFRSARRTRARLDPGTRSHSQRRARGAYPRRRTRLRGRPFGFRIRSRHRRGDQRRADVPRLPLPGRNQRKPRSPRRQPPREAAQRIQDLSRRDPRSGVPAAAGGCRKDARRGALSALGRTERLADRLPQSHGHRSHPDRQALPGARDVRVGREHRGHLPEYAAHDRGAALARFPRGGRAQHESDRGAGRHRAAQDHDARRGRHFDQRARALRDLDRGPRGPGRRGAARRRDRERVFSIEWPRAARPTEN